MIELLVAIDYRENQASPTPEWIIFWLRETRTPELLVELVERFGAEAAIQSEHRPLLRLVKANDLEGLRQALYAEVRAEQARDRAYWVPLKAELETFRRAERV